MMIVRIRHPKGVLKFDILNNETSILWLYEKAASELASQYPEVETFWISLDPQEPEKSRLTPAANSNVNLSHGQLLYLHLKKEDGNSFKNNSKSAEASLDEKLGKMNGKIIRKRDERLCRHGTVGMCEHCQPLEVKYVGLFNYYLTFTISLMIQNI